jgi:bacteriorhodopsin
MNTRRYFSVVTSLCTGAATLAYLAMASGGGQSIVGCRVFYYARSVGWVGLCALQSGAV